ncbi:Metallo-dependent phosphatase-like protein [Podospora appendiculata]|uniref:Metallo-dependent phosphatase-like protein n=1 Tax=Podospora appendiculata TaxID=314037 RepID=A0AAE0XAY4_9PEZI|nr:Metallo-dependent phosphatase-like protein [Podospora appendiculata]
MASLRNGLVAAVACCGALVSAAHAAGGDHLVSSRLSKRFIDTQGHYNMSFYHVNDVHAHLDQFSSSGTDCTNPAKGCYGGYARIKTVMDDTRASHPDSLFLNVGDEFQGTMFFTYYGGEKIAETLNQLGFDGMTIGNHEFDKGDEVLGQFLENLTFPIISANIASDNVRLNRTIKPFHIYDQFQLAVIGVTTETTPGISSPGKGTTFSDSVQAVQDTVDHIRATTNITRIAAITHIGYDEDQRLARETSGLYLIMGGHSHTLLGSMAGAEGSYPTITRNKDGDEVFIVTAYRWGEYLGYIDVTYDDEGKVLAYHGAPIHLTNATKQDPGLQKQVDAWRVPFQAFAQQEVGYSNVILDQSTCQTKECLLGDFICDAMLSYRLNATTGSTPPDFALTNAGGVRATIDAGPITRGEVLTAFPFGNAVVEITVSGARLWDTLAGIVARVNVANGKAVTSNLQVSKGIKILYAPAPNGPAGTGKLVSVTIGGKALDKNREYKIVTIDFLANGGDNMFSPAIAGFTILDTLDEVLVNYIKQQSPVDVKLDGRISEVKKCVKRKRAAQGGM